VYARLDIQIGELRDRLGGLPSPAEAAGIWKGIWLEEAHHSTAIEGNTLVLRQVEALLAEGRAVGNKQLSEYMEVKGYADAADWVYGQAIEPGDWHDGGLITLTEVRRVHEMAMTPVPREPSQARLSAQSRPAVPVRTASTACGSTERATASPSAAPRASPTSAGTW